MLRRAALVLLACTAIGLHAEVPALVLQPEVSVPVYYPRGARPEMRATAEDLARLLRLTTGAESVAAPEPLFGEAPGLHLGRTRQAARAGVGEGADRFTIAWRATEGHLYLSGGSAEAAIAGAYRFAHVYLGARWYLPTAQGEYLPPARRVEVPLLDSLFQPSYLSRYLHFYPPSEAERLWARRNGLTREIPHNHNIQRIIAAAPDVPEDWTALEYGRRQPLDSSGEGWQPNLRSESLLAHTVAVATAAFDLPHPPFAFALGMNDNYAFGDYPGDPDYPADRYYAAWPDYSNLVFGFSNRVAEAVREVHPQAHIGVLSYIPYQNVPDFPLSPALVPFVCEDTSQFYDPAYADRTRALIQAWAAKGTDYLGVRDYYFGRGFFIPRIFNAALAQSLKDSHAAGARFFFSELDPVWGYDGPKAWLTTQLLWEVEADPQSLLREYYAAVYGPDPTTVAAVERFFAATEEAWMAQSEPGAFLKFFLDAYQAALFTPGEWQALTAPLAPLEGSSLGLTLLRDARAVTAWHLEAYARHLRGEAPVRFPRQPRQPLNRRLKPEAWMLFPDNTAYQAWQASALPLPGRSLLQNSGFEFESYAWSVFPVRSEGMSFAPSTDAARQGDMGYRVRNLRHLQIFQSFRVPGPGPYLGQLSFRGALRPEDHLTVRFDWFDAEGNFLDSPPAIRAVPGEHASWTAHGTVAEAPAEAATGRLHLYIRLPGEDRSLDLDDVVVHRLPEAPAVDSQ